MKRTGDRILLWALGLSLAAHGVIALTVRTLPDVSAHPEPTPAPFTITMRPTPPPPTPVPPPPKTPSRPRPSHPTKPHVNPPPTTSDVGPTSVDDPSPGPIVDPGPVDGPGTDGPSEPPAPTPTPKPACATPYAPAKAVDVVSASVPEDAALRSGEAQIAVTLMPSGAVASVAVHRSTGDVELDHEALRAARASSYAPEIRDCSPVGGTYLFTVDFTE